MEVMLAIAEYDLWILVTYVSPWVANIQTIVTRHMYLGL